MLLYIHVPFCRSKCHYCAFASGPVCARDMQTYVNLLIRELKFWARRIPGQKIETIYFGGGTPSLVPANDLTRICNTITSLFKIASDAEITLEANPNSAHSSTYLNTIHSLGVNRLSLGVQSLDPRQLKLLGRIHSPGQALTTFTAARNAGFQNINLDFIWGIPSQNVDNWLNQLERIIDLRPEHLSCYGLSVECGTPLKRDVEQGILVLPDEDEQARMFLAGTNLLESHGYHHYEISNYALPGYQSRHNSGYWQGIEYLGLGPSAVSTIAKKRWQNPLTLRAYETAVQEDALGARPEKLGPVTQRNEHIMLSLRTARGLDLHAYHRKYKMDFCKEHQCLIEALHKNGFAHIVQQFLCLTTKGMLLSNTIIADFMDTQEPT